MARTIRACKIPVFEITKNIVSKPVCAEVQMGKSNSLPPAGHYDANYGNFQTELYAQIRQEVFGEDIGQNSWLTSDEQDKFLEWLELSPRKTLLDVACGAGGPALRIAATTGCSIVGIDVHEQAVATASSLATQRGLAERAEFRSADATGPLPFSDASFDAITCIDAINHFSDRPCVIAEWARLLKLGGRLLFTDPITLTGPLTNAEAAVRSSAGSYLFVPHGYDERVIAQCGLQLLVCEDDISAVDSSVAGCWRDAHQRLALRQDERTALAHRNPSAGRGFDVLPLDLDPTRDDFHDCVLAAGEWVLVCLPSNFLGDTDDDPKRGSSGRQLRTDQFNRTTRRTYWKLCDWFSQRSNALACSQLRVHSARLCSGGQPDS
jgi:SAM-dependent methyltransferase